MARNFDGVDDKIVYSGAAIDETAIISFSVLIKPANFTQTAKRIIHFRDGNQGFKLAFRGDGGDYFHLLTNHANGSGNWGASTSSNLRIDVGTTLKWYKISGSVSSGTGKTVVRLRIDGVNASDTSGGQFSSGNDTDTVHVGSRTSDSAFFNGDIAELQIWNGSKTDGQLDGSFLRLDHDNLVFYSRILGNVSPEVDLSGNANNGTITGTTKTNHPPVPMLTQIYRASFLDAVIAAITKEFLLGATLEKLITKTTVLGSTLSKILTKTTALGATLQKIITKDTILGATLQKVITKTYVISSTLQKVITKDTVLGSTLEKVITKTFAIGATLATTGVITKAFSIGATLQKLSITKTTALGATLEKVLTKSTALGSTLQKTITKTFVIGSTLAILLTKTTQFGSTLQKVITKDTALGATLHKNSILKTFAIGATLSSDIVTGGQTVPFGNASAQETSNFGNAKAQETTSFGTAKAQDSLNLGDAKG